MSVARSKRKLSWWTFAFTVNFFFQLYRNNLRDIFIFTLALAILILESLHFLDWIPEVKSLRKSRINIVVLALMSLYIFLAKPGTNLTFYLFLILLLFMFVDLWRKDDGDQVRLTESEVESTKIWIAIGTLLCGWELLAYVLATINHDDFSHPTISVLLEPALLNPIFRGLFVISWASIGLLLIRDWREPD